MAKTVIFNVVMIASLFYFASIAESQLIESQVKDANGKVIRFKRYAKPKAEEPSPSSDALQLHTKSKMGAPSPGSHGIGPIGFLVCNKVHGVARGETCYDVATKASLSLSSFQGINPNLNCDKLFVGQWLCMNAAV